MRIDNSTASTWKKQPPVSFMQRMSSTSSIDKLQVTTGDGQVLPKNPNYVNFKQATEAYKSFYEIPEKLPEIKFVKKDRIEESKKQNDEQIQKTDQNNETIKSSNIIDFQAYLKTSETHQDHLQPSGYTNVKTFSAYISPTPETRGNHLDLYV